MKGVQRKSSSQRNPWKRNEVFGLFIGDLQWWEELWLAPMGAHSGAPQAKDGEPKILAPKFWGEPCQAGNVGSSDMANWEVSFLDTMFSTWLQPDSNFPHSRGR